MEDVLCDLTYTLIQAQEIDTAERVFNVGNDYARLQSIEQNNKMWELHFLRIRKDNFPLKVHDNGQVYYFNDLTDEEGFGEEVSALYDPENQTIMIRRNRDSLSPSAIANYFTTLINRPSFTVYFKPLVHPRALELLKKDHLIRGAEVTIADIKNAGTKTKKSLGNLIKPVEDIQESVNIHFKISLEQKGSKKGSKLPIYDELVSFASDEHVTKAEIRIKANEDARVETVDLIKNRLVDYHLFSDEDINPDSRNILHETVISVMHQLYRKRVNEINNIYV